MLAELVVWYLVFVFSTTFHEFSHALVGRIGGDRTAQHAGLVTMDPTVHILRSPFGMLVMPVLSFVLYQWMIGWASVPYDPVWGRRHPWRSALMSAAGPIANFVLAALGIVVLRVLLSRGVLVTPLNRLDQGFVRNRIVSSHSNSMYASPA